jgi:hypothetical protein
MLNAKKGSKAETIVIPDESACGGRDPWFDRLTTLSKVEGVSSNEWFCWIPDSRCAPSGMTGLVLPL